MKSYLQKTRRPRVLKTLPRHEILRRVLVTALVALHVTSLCWWLVPMNGYPSDWRTRQAPAWVESLESRISHWKRAIAGTNLAQFLESYIFLTASWQQWWMFAPNPTDAHHWITVYAVKAWREPTPTEKAMPVPIWKDYRQPVYDPEPIYQSYPGPLEESLHGHAGFYRHDSKMVENFVTGKWDELIGSFAKWASTQYRLKTGNYPLGVHVILHKGKIPKPFEGRSVASQEVSERILWYLHY